MPESILTEVFLASTRPQIHGKIQINIWELHGSYAVLKLLEHQIGAELKVTDLR